jgi:hypothetical protein
VCNGDNKTFVIGNCSTAMSDPTEPPENGEADPESSQSLALVISGSAPFAALTPDPDSALHHFDWPPRGADSLC